VEQSISPGAILWVRLRRGGNKERPAVVLSAPNSDGWLTVVVASTQSHDQNREVELPSDANRHPRTKLRKRTFVDIDWVERIRISVDNVPEVKGFVPSTTLERIWDKIREASPTPPEPT
jgi:mRNA-degrading endonuclease toxin of MazEF toxin-antitoxin module